MASWPHVVVVVARGFAGLKVCHALARQPLHYQVASGLVSEADVASPLRQMVGEAPNIQILLGEVVAIAPEPPRWC